MFICVSTPVVVVYKSEKKKIGSVLDRLCYLRRCLPSLAGPSVRCGFAHVKKSNGAHDMQKNCSGCHNVPFLFVCFPSDM